MIDFYTGMLIVFLVFFITFWVPFMVFGVVYAAQRGWGSAIVMNIKDMGAVDLTAVCPCPYCTSIREKTDGMPALGRNITQD